jgi:hypothetical protein
VLHHLHKPARRHDARKKAAATLLGAGVPRRAHLAFLAVALARARADATETSASRGASRGTSRLGGVLRGFGSAAAAAAAAAARRGARSSLAFAARALRDACVAIIDVLSLKSAWETREDPLAFGALDLSRAPTAWRRRAFPSLRAAALRGAAPAGVRGGRGVPQRARRGGPHVPLLRRGVLAARRQKRPRGEVEDVSSYRKPPKLTSARAARDAFPKVVVQLPMFNEREVCGDIIDKACELDWPRSRVLVQVLDDSTCLETRRIVDDKVFEWRERGANVVARRRKNRDGYKAGAMVDRRARLARSPTGASGAVLPWARRER